MKSDFIVSVSSLVLKIKNVLNQNIQLNEVWIQGEISNLTKHRSGHYYFSLKDAYASINCVMFSSYTKNINFNLQEGTKVCVQGSIQVYEPRGSLQLYVKTMKEDGIGQLYQEYEQRKSRLFQEGYFNLDHKTIKPDWIENIGIVTAKEGAALQDVLKTISHRFPAMKIKLYPAYVQGKNASQSIIQALKKADLNQHDAILLVRGGGSFEDLFCFNDEDLVKCIFHLQTFIVTGIGHETDTSLADLAGDYRALTPTAAAQYVSVDVHELRNKWKQLHISLISSMKMNLNQKKMQLSHIQSHPYLIDPHTFIVDKTILLDSYDFVFQNTRNQLSIYESKLKENKTKLNSYTSLFLENYKIKKNNIFLMNAIQSYFEQQNLLFQKNIKLLDAFSPLKILSRGYSIAQKENKIIRSINDVKLKDEIKIVLHDGFLVTKIQKKEG
ncbi:exodeoxyribonuclease VII large subunit [Floccifex sp.]|uniref:exodeoxyribonuclease VII large subunit n=1 Tax=Floccifex sp. TaxID=2815810 RepID=UPI003F07BAB4